MPGSGVRVSPQLLKGSSAESSGVHIRRRFARNSGQTPAYDVKIEAGTFLAEPELDSTEDWSLPVTGEAKVSRGTIAPAAAIYQFYDGGTIKADGLQLLRDGTRRLFFAGSISYRDAFSENRQTNFRLMREPGTHAFIACVKGNDSD